jgi:hypothetical protein
MFYSALFRLFSLHELSFSDPVSLCLFSIRLWALGLLFLVFTSSPIAAQVTLQWDATPDPQMVGYKVYYGSASRQYSVTVNAGTSTTAAFSRLRDAQIYYFTVTAYDASGKESAFSNEVSYDLAKLDTDKDGLNDWDEISLYKTDPNLADTDGDGLSDGEEVKLYKTDPTKAGTDGDGVPNAVEVNPESNPPDPTPMPTPSRPIFAVNAGGPQYTATNGNVYLADTGFIGGATYTTTATTAGTADSKLYQSERHGNFSYAIPVNNGDYLVTLRFAEISLSSIGERVFDVEIEGALVIDNLDLIARVGKNTAYDVVVSVHVTDGVLNVAFRSAVGSAKVSAIEVSQAVNSPKHWTDYGVSLKMWSGDDDSIGVMFRYQDGNNYYRFSWDSERAYRRLVRRKSGIFTLLAEDAVPYVSGRVYQVGIVADGAALEVWIDGMKIFSVTDSSFAEGSIALYTWYNSGSHFDDIVVTNLDTQATLLSTNLSGGDLSDWNVVDDGRSEGPSKWSIANGAVLQDSNLYSAPTSKQDITKLGTYLLYTGGEGAI